MKWKILAIGKPSLGYAKAGVEEYLKRIRRYASAEISFFKEKGEEENSRRLLEASEGCFRIVLDERGRLLTTAGLAKQLETWESRPIKQGAVLIGGADGHSSEVRDSADFVLGLSLLTLQHELALVVWLEQFYRVCALRRGEPYHR
jgi:23S rRNA (pseudouridine1915-N3)-methyltransferase